MPIRYTIDKERRLVISTGEGGITYDEIRNHQMRLVKDLDFDASFNQLIDLTGAASLEISGKEAVVIAQQPIFSNSSRRAFVASKPAIFGMGRLMQVYQERHAQVHIFHDLDSARKWLGLGEEEKKP